MTKISSTPQVTITLGRTGQVVTKGGKRSGVDTFGSNGDNFSYKRHQGNGFKWSPGLGEATGSQIAPNDLRLKLMRKRQSRQVKNVVAGREKRGLHGQLLKAPHPRTSSYMASHRPNPDGIPLSRQIPHDEIVNDSRQLDYIGEFHSSQNLGGPRAISPDRIVKSSILHSYPNSFDGARKVTRWGAADVAREGQFISNELVDTSWQTGSTPVRVNANIQAGNPVSRVAPTGRIMHKVPYMGEEPPTISSFLQSLGLGKYAINFQAEEVDMSVLKQMQDKDLKEMGIPMGPRKKILLALFPHHKQQTSAP